MDTLSNCSVCSHAAFVTTALVTFGLRLCCLLPRLTARQQAALPAAMATLTSGRHLQRTTWQRRRTRWPTYTAPLRPPITTFRTCTARHRTILIRTGGCLTSPPARVVPLEAAHKQHSSGGVRVLLLRVTAPGARPRTHTCLLSRGSLRALSALTGCAASSAPCPHYRRWRRRGWDRAGCRRT